MQHEETASAWPKSKALKHSTCSHGCSCCQHQNLLCAAGICEWFSRSTLQVAMVTECNALPAGACRAFQHYLCMIVHAVRICEQIALALVHSDEAAAGARHLTFALPRQRIIGLAVRCVHLDT
eukprot:58503-Chlamydomonas_euryale.AAC.3